MTEAEDACDNVLKSLQWPRDINKYPDFIKSVFNSAVIECRKNIMTKILSDCPQPELNRLADSIRDEMRSTASPIQTLKKIMLLDASIEGPIHSTNASLFQTMQKVRGDIFEVLISKALHKLKINHVRVHKNGYPDIVIGSLDDPSAYVTLKVSLRERYRQAISEKKNMDSNGYPAAFYLLILDDTVAESTLRELEDAGVHIVTLNKLPSLLTNLQESEG